MKQIPSEIPPVEQKIFPWPETDGWVVQKTADGKCYVKIIHVDTLPGWMEHNGPTDWIGVTNPKFKKGFIIFLDREVESLKVCQPIVIKKIFRSCGMGEFE